MLRHNTTDHNSISQITVPRRCYLYHNTIHIPRFKLIIVLSINNCSFIIDTELSPMLRNLYRAKTLEWYMTSNGSQGQRGTMLWTYNLTPWAIRLVVVRRRVSVTDWIYRWTDVNIKQSDLVNSCFFLIRVCHNPCVSQSVCVTIRAHFLDPPLPFFAYLHWFSNPNVSQSGHVLMGRPTNCSDKQGLTILVYLLDWMDREAVCSCCREIQLDCLSDSHKL